MSASNEVTKCATYIVRNRWRMRYPKFPSQGLCTSTGVFEAGCKTVAKPEESKEPCVIRWVSVFYLFFTGESLRARPLIRHKCPPPGWRAPYCTQAYPQPRPAINPDHAVATHVRNGGAERGLQGARILCLIRRSSHCRHRRLRTDPSYPAKTERLQRAQFDGFDASTLRIIEQQAPAAIHLDPRRTLHLEQAVSGQHEFHYQVQVVHLFGTATG